MFLAKIKNRITSVHKVEAYEGKRIFIIPPITPNGDFTGEESVAMDYVGSGIGYTVVCGGAPGVARRFLT